MSSLLIASCYGSAALIALFALWRFGTKGWYWHVASVLLAFGIGSIPLTGTFNRPVWTLIVGWFFVLFLLWGLAAPVVAAMRRSKQLQWRQG